MRSSSIDEAIDSHVDGVFGASEHGEVGFEVSETVLEESSESIASFFVLTAGHSFEVLLLGVDFSNGLIFGLGAGAGGFRFDSFVFSKGALLGLVIRLSGVDDSLFLSFFLGGLNKNLFFFLFFLRGSFLELPEDVLEQVHNG